jgi:hypothetical protein
MEQKRDEPLESEQRNRGKWRGEEGGLGVADAGGHLPPESERSPGDEDKNGDHVAPTLAPPD